MQMITWKRHLDTQTKAYRSDALLQICSFVSDSDREYENNEDYELLDRDNGRLRC